MNRKLISIIYTLVPAALLISCNQSGVNTASQSEYVVETQVQHPDWTEDAVIYEVNLRQHTQEGTLQAFAEDLPRLNEMGVDILWLMPIYPIGETNRKVSQTKLIEEIDPAERDKYLGSYYSTKDYLSVNPEFGNMKDLKDLVKDAHALGMYVILDIAANHTAWDHPWIKEHPEYYTSVHPDSVPWNTEWMAAHPGYYTFLQQLGMTYPIHPDETDWWDVADLNYNNPGLRSAMLDVFKYWVEEADIDGYRCDVAGWVPCDFWNDVRSSLDSIKEVFMLAEDEADRCLLEKAFDMNYAWELHHIFNEVAKGEMTVADLENYFIRHDSIYDPAIYRMNFITNHDENSWNGTVFERFGEAAEVYAMLSFTVPGMPLIYSGQEAGMNKRLKFFEKDVIDWSENPWEEIYTSFIQLKTDYEVFWNGTAGGTMEILDFPDSGKIFAFKRATDDEEIIVLANLGEEKVKVNLSQKYPETEWANLLDPDEDTESDMELKAFGYKILLGE